MAVSSNMLPLGTPLPRFSLPDASTGKQVASDGLQGRIAVVAFLCNHCPYVKHIRGALAEWEAREASEGNGSVAVAVVRRFLDRMKLVQKGASMAAKAAERIEKALVNLQVPEKIRAHILEKKDPGILAKNLKDHLLLVTGDIDNNVHHAGTFRVADALVLDAQEVEDVVALLVESALAGAGSLECSDPLINRIHQVNRWTLRCLDLGGYMVDCPHRERFGYGGDMVAASEMAILNFDMARFYAKAVQDLADAARPNGGFTETAPFVGIADDGLGEEL